jgi:hypothetical protein
VSGGPPDNTRDIEDLIPTSWLWEQILILLLSFAEGDLHARDPLDKLLFAGFD